MIPQLPTTPPQPVRALHSEIPRSPPKWPLRPGVMVHVKVDTKQNLCATRTTNQDDSATVATISPSSTFIQQQKQQQQPFNEQDKQQSIKQQQKEVEFPSNVVGSETMAQIQTENEIHSTVNDELINFTSSNLIERILKRLRWRRANCEKINGANSMRVGDGNGSRGGSIGQRNGMGRRSIRGSNTRGGNNIKGNRRAVNILRSTGWFGSGKSTTSSTGLVGENQKEHHRLSGIECSDDGKWNKKKDLT